MMRCKSNRETKLWTCLTCISSFKVPWFTGFLPGYFKWGNASQTLGMYASARDGINNNKTKTITRCRVCVWFAKYMKMKRACRNTVLPRCTRRKRFPRWVVFPKTDETAGEEPFPIFTYMPSILPPYHTYIIQRRYPENKLILLLSLVSLPTKQKTRIHLPSPISPTGVWTLATTRTRLAWVIPQPHHAALIMCLSLIFAIIVDKQAQSVVVANYSLLTRRRHEVWISTKN